MQDFRKLDVWARSYKLTLAVYEDSARLPDDERFGLISQMRRAAASIVANIAAGCGRDGDAGLKRFLEIAMGSASEFELHLMLAHDLGCLTDQNYQPLHQDTAACKRMLAALIVKLRPPRPRGQTERLTD